MTDGSRSRRVPAAVLWDMDGTLVDTEPYWIAGEYELVAEHGGTWGDEHAHAIVGMDLRDAAAYISEHGSVDLPVDDIVNRLLDGVTLRVREHVPWRPGARELLADLRSNGVPTALVTMSWRRFAEAVVEALPPDSFDVIERFIWVCPLTILIGLGVVRLVRRLKSRRENGLPVG